MKTILVPVDFSDLAISVIEMAAKIAGAFNSKIRLIHVLSSQPYYVGIEMGADVVQEVKKEERKRIENDIAAMEEYLRSKGLDVTSVIDEGKVINTILEECSHCDADLIVIGSKNLGVLSRTLLGSVSEGVLRKSPCPVLIVPYHE